jgi:hypothetical protein
MQIPQKFTPLSLPIKKYQPAFYLKAGWEFF